MLLPERTWPFALPPALATALTAAYATPPRAYHHLGHVADVLAEFDQVTADAPWRQPVEVVVAILFHDAIYLAGRADNERKSAALARAVMPTAAPAIAVDHARVDHLIELTARHGTLTPADVAGDPDAARFLDADMAILGAAPEAFDRYERAIAAEYAAIPADAYRDGRARFLTRALATPRLYLSDAAHARLDAPARANLGRALALIR
jgi:predicted metal-dependent HD superfamily phosphohydrolase